MVSERELPSQLDGAPRQIQALQLRHSLRARASRRQELSLGRRGISRGGVCEGQARPPHTKRTRREKICREEDFINTLLSRVAVVSQVTQLLVLALG